MGLGIGLLEMIILVACPLTLALALVALLAMAMANKRRGTASLVNCPGCGNGVSTKAPACPHCGRPMA